MAKKFEGNFHESPAQKEIPFPPDPRSGLSWNEEGELVDSKGNIYDKNGENIIGEAPSQEFLAELEKMRGRYPALSEKELMQFARGNINKRNREAEKKSRKKKTR
jgi:hypothetical protein